MKARWPFPLSAVLVALAAFAPHMTTAAIGGSVDSIEADRSPLSAFRGREVSASAYTIHELVSDSGTVREFVSRAGIVFGIAWSGIANPDLSRLLGKYASEYRQAFLVAPRKHGQRHSEIRSDHLVVARWGHMRRLQGRAYDPALLPEGVNIDEIR